MCLRIYSRVSELTSWLLTVFWKHDSWQSWLTFKWLAIVVITITHGPHIEDSQLVQWIWTADIREVETFHKIISWLFSFPNLSDPWSFYVLLKSHEWHCALQNYFKFFHAIQNKELLPVFRLCFQPSRVNHLPFCREISLLVSYWVGASQQSLASVPTPSTQWDGEWWWPLDNL